MFDCAAYFDQNISISAVLLMNKITRQNNSQLY